MAEFKIGDLVWAKMKGYSPWPSRIIDPVKDVKSPKSKEPMYCVTFFGTRQQIAFVGESDILTFDEGKEKCGQKKSAGKFKAAVEEMYATAVSENYSARRPSLPRHDDERKSSERISQDVPKSKKSTFGKDRAKTAVKKAVSISTRKALFSPDDRKQHMKRALSRSNSKIAEKRRRFTSPATAMSDSLLSTPRSIAEETSSSLQLARRFPRSLPSSSTQNFTSRISSDSSKMSNLLSSIPLPQYDKDVDIEGNCFHLSSTNIGFIGLGGMGRIILDHLINSKTSKTKRRITIWNRSIDKCKEFQAKGCAVAETPAELMMKSDIVISCVSDRSAVRSIVCAKNVGILSGLTLGKGYVEMTTVDPDFSQNICRNITSRRGRYLEVPMLGRRKHARDASLLLLAAGDRDLFKACCDCFRDMGEHVFFLGDVGNASKMNLIVNMVLGTCFATVTEAMNLAERAGISPKDVLDLLKQGHLNCPAIIEQGNAILKLQENPKRKFDNMPVEHMQRNLRLALEIANNYMQPIPTIAAVNDVYQSIRRRDQYRKHRSDVTEMYRVLTEDFKDLPTCHE